jgi:hypothetical protein
MTTFLIVIAANLVTWALILACARLLPRRPRVTECAFCGHESTSHAEIVRHVCECEKHPMKAVIDSLRMELGELQADCDEYRRRLRGR